jgi:hypothetical protein
VYVREPHPGENYTEHRSWEQKLQYARECREQDGIETKMLIDGIDGAMHQAYGEMPNMAFIVGKDGTIVYKSMWTDHADIEAMIKTLLGVEDATAKGCAPARPTRSASATSRATRRRLVRRCSEGRAQRRFRTSRTRSAGKGPRIDLPC